MPIRFAGPRRVRRRIGCGRLAAALLLALLLPACGGSRTPDLVVILVDTLRPDRLGAYGSTRGLTPFLDELAARSYVFHQAYAQSSFTNPSVASLFTSRFQSQHRVLWFDSVLDAEELTLAEVLGGHGYASGAFIANVLLRAGAGFDQGFAAYRTYAGADWSKARGERLNREAFSWLDGLGAAGQRPPVFLYLHYMEPHNPYDPPQPILERVLAGRPMPDRRRANATMVVQLGAAAPDRLEAIETLYDAEVASLDADLRALFDGLRARGVLDDAVVVLVADHGEEFNEHGQVGHNKTLFEEVIRVPFLIHLPGQQTRVDVQRTVTLADVAPTLLSLASLPVPPRFEGQALTDSVLPPPGVSGALRAAWRRVTGPPPPAPALSELIRPADRPRTSPHQHALIAGTEKLIAGVDGEREYYDLAADGGETRPDGLPPERREALQGMLTGWLTALAEHAASGGATGLDEQTRERMRALGYGE